MAPIIEGVDLRTRGLPCRGGCQVVFEGTKLSDSNAKAFRLLCDQRIDHEKRVHGYSHAEEKPFKPGFSWNKANRRSAFDW